MKNLGLLTANGKYSNLAYIVSDQNPYGIKLAVYRGNEKVEFVDRKELTLGSVFAAFEGAMDYLALVNKVSGKIIGVKRIDQPEYNLEILRECLINSIMHRNYEIYTNILVNIFEDGIEIVNVGGLIKGLTLEDIKNGSSASRNPKLVDIFHRLNYGEAYGSGIPRIMASYKFQEVKPVITVAPNSFSIKLPKIVYGEDIEKILDIIKQNGSITREDVEKNFGYGKTKAVELLNKCVNYNILKKISIGKKTYYELY